jgi:membrane-associated phospholipid phosphatase
MNSLRRLDDRLLGDVNDLARHTGWLHGVILGYATYGLVFFAALMLIALLVRRRGSDRGLAAAGWAALATLIAFSRVYIAAHYPWDVVAGLAFGALVAVLGWWLLRRPLIAVTVWLRRRPGVRTAFGPVLARA